MAINLTTVTSVAENLTSNFHITNASLLDVLNNLYRDQSLPLVAFMVCLMVLGIPGNFLVIWVYTYKNSRSVANCFMISLAWVDLCACLLIHPYIIHKHFAFYTSTEVICKVAEYLLHTMLSVQIGILCSVAVDRYYAVCKPLRFIYYYNRAVVMVIGSIIGGMLFSLPLLVFYGQNTVTLDLGQDGVVYGKVCHYNDKYDGSVVASIYMGTTALIMVGVLCAMTVLYALVTIQVCRKHRLVYPVDNVDNASKAVVKDKQLSVQSGGDNREPINIIKNRNSASAKAFLPATAKSLPVNLCKARDIVCATTSHHKTSDDTEKGCVLQEAVHSGHANGAEADCIETVMRINSDTDKTCILSTDLTGYHRQEIIKSINGQHLKESNTDENWLGESCLMPEDYQLEQITELEDAPERPNSRDASLPVNKICIYTRSLDDRQPCFTETCPANRSLTCSNVPLLLFQKSSFRRKQSSSPHKTVTFDEDPYVHDIGSGKKIEENTGQNTQMSKSGGGVLCPGFKAAKMLSIVTAIFFLSWLPFWVLRVKSLYEPHSWTLGDISGSVLFQILNHLFYLNNSINPILYSLINNNFRKDLKAAWSKSILNKKCKKKHKKRKRKVKIFHVDVEGNN